MAFVQHICPLKRAQQEREALSGKKEPEDQESLCNGKQQQKGKDGRVLCDCASCAMVKDRLGVED